MLGTGVVLPSYNAARFLEQVIADIREQVPGIRILVVDDGSSDGTADVARQSDVEVIVHEVNRGKGGALATGNAWALEQDLEWVYTMDADGQHLPGEMPDFMRVATEGNYDVVVGNRMDATADMPWLRKRTNEFTSWVVSKLAGVHIPDSQNGYRLFHVPCLEGVQLRTTRYDTETEILVRLARRGYRIGAVPVSTIYGDEKSSINPFVDTGRFFRLVTILLLSRRDERRSQ